MSPSRLRSADDVDRASAVRVLAASARHAALALDAARVAELDDRIAEARPTSTDVAAELVAAWRALLSGAHALASELAGTCGARASELRQPDLVVDAASLAALARLASGDLASGVKAARRASRMARTEGIPLCEALAHLVLARARRASGHAHLALRITRALAALPVTSHRAWLAFEHALAGGSASVDDGRSLASALHAWCDAAESGSRARFDDATRALHTSAASAPAFLRDDVETLVLACDPDRDPRGTSLEGFLLGATSEMPPALHGVATTRGLVTEPAILYALQRRGSPPRRVVRLGRGLAGDDLPALQQSRRHQGRAETVVATLLLAGPRGLDEGECFRAVYGFEFVPEIHRGALDVALHRAREWLGGIARLERQGSHVRLDAERGLVCPDPRAGRSLADKILAALAEDRGRSAKELAEAVGAPLRAAQAALATLVEDGACEARRAGRVLEYHLEDTTFSEPTYVR
ncbi:winged helix-turn-helix domain-containing protein [Sandaracinus amylolyticus]|uniref:winged helix-turn-helix domain-containing protein n=1 Tax=Sandaracinus amylolyticus TaxID=927083 RepID=UPI001F2EC7B7|nr:winged helix-turn-helix domain-containing protein [Sandaracinus amylolyticus]